ncbi:sigma 54-interacting transcriptional regulator [uncultured Mailhella sp.]|uniref:sigma 54-interacting transcriptional regulator n=1 Tax=uncultured Mailhella sp. TaxID=1981031 RepID=UPI002631165D|nr:sigma 54-interacting transcriptional regulator [uncultured Mailhella sp.]
MRCKIGILTYGILNELAQEALQLINDPEICPAILKGLGNQLLGQVLKAQADGVHVFVGGGANARFIREKARVPLVIFNFGLHDFLPVFRQARRYGRCIGLASVNENDIKLCRELEGLLDCIIIPLIFSNHEELSTLISKKKPDVVIGASLAQNVCKHLNIPFFLVYSGKQTIINAIQMAKSLTEDIIREKKRQQQLQAIVDYAWGGIIATDREGKIITCNSSAQKMLNLRREEVFGKPLKGVLQNCSLTSLPQDSLPKIKFFDVIHGKQMVVNSIPLMVSGENEGTVITFQKIEELQHIERKARSSMPQTVFKTTYSFADILGESVAISKLCDRARKYGKSDSSIYISGETGVGKEVLAQAIHNISPMKDGPFVAVNCAALPDSLIESELFGYEEGAFTGARKGGKAGMFELAHNGTLFLDEVDQIPFSLQAHLLRALQEKEIMRLGGRGAVHVNIRVIAASNTPLLQSVEKQRFRADLYYRLNVFQLDVPPLREREDDVLILFYHMLSRLDRHMTEVLATHKSLMQKILTAYSWPGNIRELDNVVRRFAVLLEDFSYSGVYNTLIESIGVEMFIQDIINRSTSNKQKNLSPTQLREIAWFCEGRLQVLADLLGVSRTTLWRQLQDK